MTLEEARDRLAKDLLRFVEFHGVPNRVLPSDMYELPPMLAGRIGRRYINSLQNEITRLHPGQGLRVAYNRFKPDQQRTFHVWKEAQ
jgi:hypothetical protein